MMPFKAPRVLPESLKVLWLEGAGAARLVLVSLLPVESIKVVVGSKLRIQEDLP
jgi:hypothetical protein